MATESTALYEITRDKPRSLASERLPFTLPDFTRYAWTSETAKTTWEPRIARILQAWQEIEWLSVAAGARACALLWIGNENLSQFIPKWEAAELSAVALDFGSYDGGRGQGAPDNLSGMTCVVVGALDQTKQLQDAWRRADEDTIGALLGYPTCCRAFFQDVWATQGYIDTTWVMAENTVGPGKYGLLKIDLPAHVLPLANILWRWIGVRAAPHLPCRFDCSDSIELGRRMLEVARQHGLSQEADWITEILAWPAEWSALHGIAEVKSPLMKLSTRTDATAGKWTVQWLGSAYPAEGGVGLHFPFKPPKKLGRTNSPPDRARNSASLSWQYTDNGFASFAAMEELHKPIVELAREDLADRSGDVLDLGCGNGMLLSKVCAARNDLIPYGVDTNQLAMDHARELLPLFAKNFVHGDLFDASLWAGSNRRYTLAILMLGRLLEVPPDKSKQMIDALQRSCSRILVYLYSDWRNQSLKGIARQFDLGLKESRYPGVAFLK